jgi:GMP synthase-like glutamine amidotransferase
VSEWLRERGLRFAVHHVWAEPLPDPTESAFVISLGSEASAGASQPTWVPEEIATLRAAIGADVPVLGLCFGGQALSVALGGGVDPLSRPEIGWFPVDTVDGAVPRGPWLQYHSELMRVPAGAQELARSPAGPAVFRSGPHVGLQFHPEVDEALVDRWARSDPKLAESGITLDDLAAQSAAYAPDAREQAFRLFDWWLDG